MQAGRAKQQRGTCACRQRPSVALLGTRSSSLRSCCGPTSSTFGVRGATPMSGIGSPRPWAQHRGEKLNGDVKQYFLLYEGVELRFEHRLNAVCPGSNIARGPRCRRSVGRKPHKPMASACGIAVPTSTQSWMSEA